MEIRHTPTHLLVRSLWSSSNSEQAIVGPIKYRSCPLCDIDIEIIHTRHRNIIVFIVALIYKEQHIPLISSGEWSELNSACSDFPPTEKYITFEAICLDRERFSLKTTL